MAGASCLLPFLTQVKNARVEIESNFSRLIQNIHLLQSKLMGEVEEMENDYLEEVQKEEELKRLTKHLSDTVSRSHMGAHVSSITDQIQHILSGNTSKLLVIDWELSTEQTLLNKFCKISVTKHTADTPEDPLIESMHELTISETNPHSFSHSYLTLHTTLSSTSSSEEETILTLEQKYKQISESTNSFYDSWDVLQGPRGVSIDDNTDDIYVADYDNHFILVFERDASYIRKFTHNRMVHPVGICVSGNLDRLYITLSGREAVHCYKLNGTFIKEITQYGANCNAFDNPAGITMDNEERVYVCDRGRDRVVVFTRYLVYITVLTTQLTDPRDVKIVGSEVAILHHGEYLVSFFTRGGMFIRRVVKKGNNKQKVGHPSFFCIDSENNILITDSKQNCIKIYRTTGFHICNIACEGNSDDEFVKPVGISLFDDNSIAVLCDRDEEQLQVYEL